MMLPSPFPPNPYLGILVSLLRAARGEQVRVEQVCVRTDGTTSYVRFEPSRRTSYVRVHVQSTGVGMGGAAYDPDHFVSSAEVDCRSATIQDQTVTRNGSDRYYVWLIPVEKAADGTTVLYDGQDGRPDYMSFADLGV